MPRLTDAPADLRRFFAQQIQAGSGTAEARVSTAREAATARFSDASAHLGTVAGAYAAAADPLRLAEQELAALAEALGSSSEQLQENLSTGLTEALEVAAPLASSARARPTITGLLSQALGADDDPKLLSLSLLDVGPSVLANPTVAKRHVDNYYDYTACHDVAARLNRILGAGDPKTAKGAEGIALAKAALETENAVVHMMYKHPRGDGHSFTLVATPDGVESLEGWAGADARYAFPLHECVFDRPRDGIRPDRAQAALDDVLHPRRSRRAAALDTLSRAGLPGFEARYPASQMELTVTVRRLDEPERIATEMDRRVRTARELVATTAALTNPEASVEDLQAALALAQEAHEAPDEAQLRAVLERRGDAPARIDAIVQGLTALGLL